MEVTHTVLLVDLDLRRPTIHKYFGDEPELGLTDYLTGRYAAAPDAVLAVH